MSKNYRMLNVFWCAFVLLGNISCDKKTETTTPPDIPLVANFSVTNNGCTAPCVIEINNESSGATSFQWDFGNGTESTDENPSPIQYDNHGVYTIRLTVLNEKGETQSAERTVTIEQPKLPLDFITGTDLSYQPLLDENSIVFKDENGNSINNFYEYATQNGVNLIRVRLFNSPNPGDKVLSKNNLTEVLEICEKVKAAGNNILLDFHYSDTWADPGKQFVPAAWDGQSFEAVRDSVYAFTKFVLERLNAQNTLPEIIQVGNEINSGMLWEYGKVWGDFDDNWGNLVTLINAAKQAVSEIEQISGTEIQTMIHIAGITDAHWFFDKLFDHGASFDLIGLSYYPWWHGTDLTEIENALQQMATKYTQPIIIAETMYPFTFEWNDWTNNVVGNSAQIVNGYPATPEGQKDFYENLTQILKNLPDEKGKGFIYWAPDYVAYDGNQSNEGSAFENLCMFDFELKALPVWEVFRG